MINRITIALVLALACFTSVHAADAVKALPTANLSGIDKENADEISRYVERFNTRKATLSGGELAEAYADVGAVHARVGKFDVAEVAFANAAAIAPQDGRWPYLQGLVALARGQEPAALIFFERSFKLNSGYVPGRMAFANALIRVNQLDRARAILDEFVAKEQTYPMPYAVLGDIAVRQQRYDDAVKLFKSGLAAEPRANQLYGALAYAQEKAGDSKGAAASRAKAGDVSPTLPDPMMERILPIIDLKAPAISAEPPAAAAAAEGSAGTEPPAAGPKQNALVAASMSATAGNFAEARKTLDSALKQFPNDHDLMLSYARVEAAAGKFDAARARAKAATVAAPKEIGSWYVLGLIEEGAGDDAAAIAAYSKALGIDKGNARARIAIGSVQMRKGNTADAMKTFRDTLAGSPTSTDARAHLIAAQVIAGQCSDAVKDTGDAVTKSPRDAGIAELYVRVASTCRGATVEQRKRATSIGENLYNSPLGSSAQVSEAYALSLAMNGKWEDAEQTQVAALFDAAKNGNEASLALYRDFYAKFQAKQLPDRPWSAAHPLLKPVRPTFKAPVPVTKSGSAKPAAAPAAAPAKK